MTNNPINQRLTELQTFIMTETATGKQAYLEQHPKLQEIRQAILDLATDYGAYDVRVFGSVARGEAETKSDLDLLVSLEPGRSLFDLGGLLMDLQTTLGLPVDVVTFNGLKPRLREQVLSEARPL